MVIKCVRFIRLFINYCASQCHSDIREATESGAYCAGMVARNGIREAPKKGEHRAGKGSGKH